MKKFLSVLMAITMMLCLVPSSLALAENDELLKNPGMETMDWWASMGSAGTAEITAEEKRNGDASLKMLPGAWVRGEIFEVCKSQVYNFSVWLKGTNRALIYVTAFDEDMNELPSIWGGNNAFGSQVYDDTKTVAERNDWKQVSFCVTPEWYVKETKYIRISFRVLNGDNCENIPVYADDASMKTVDIGVDVSKNVAPGFSIGNTTSTKYTETYKNGGRATDDYRTTPYSAKLSYAPDKVSQVRGAVEYTNIDTSGVYEVSAWMKTDGNFDGKIDIVLYSSNTACNKWYNLKRNVVPTNEWQRYSACVYIPDTELDESVSPLIYVNKTAQNSGSLWVDDLTVTPVEGFSENLLEMPSIESTSGWWISGSDSTGRMFDTTVNHYDFYNKENRSIRLGTGSTIESANYFTAGNPVTLDPEKEYELSFWAKASSDNAGALNIINSTRSLIDVIPGTQVYPTTEWKQYKVVVDMNRLMQNSDFTNTAEDKFHKFRPRFSVWDGFDGYVWIDDVTLNEVSYGYAGKDVPTNMTWPVVTVNASDNTVLAKAYFNASDYVTVIAAVYGADGKIFKDCGALSKEVYAGDNQFKVKLNNPLEAGEVVKVMIVDDFAGITPVKIATTATVK